MLIKQKLKNTVMGRAGANAENVMKVLRSDENHLLSDYFVFDPSDLKIEADILPSGDITLTLKLRASSFKEAGKVLD